MFKLLMATGEGLNQPELVEVVSNDSKKTIDWLIRLGTDMWEGAYVGVPFGCELYPEYAYLAPPAPRVEVVKGMGGPFNRVHHDEQGLGYSVFYYEQWMNMGKATKLIAADGVMPTSETIADGRYPFTAEVYVVVRKGMRPSAPAMYLRDWLLSEEGQTIVAESRYVPLRR